MTDLGRKLYWHVVLYDLK